MRTLLAGARVFEPRSGSLSVADVVIENGRIADVGTGLDGDESVDLSDRVLLPGIDGVAGAKAARELQLALLQVGDDDGRGAGQVGADDHAEPHPAG